MHFFLIGLIGLFGFSVHAKPDDKQKPIHFSAGQIEWDHLSSKGIFSNKVIFIQGTTEINGESGYSIGDTTHQFKKVVLKGSSEQQASFKTIPKENEPTLIAYADKMVYLPVDQMIKLIGHVKIHQARYHFQAPYLEYHLTSKKMISKSTTHDMTTILIDPEKNEKHT